MNLSLHDLQINCCFLLAVKPFLITLLDLQLGQIFLSLNLTRAYGELNEVIHEVSFFIIFFVLRALDIKKR